MSAPSPPEPNALEANPGGPWSAELWGTWLTGQLSRPVRVQFGRARRNVIVVQSGPDGFEIRMNAMFAEAPADVREALAAWLRSGRRARRACQDLDRWIEQRLSTLEPPRPKPSAIRPRGEHHDLSPLMAELLAEEFPGAQFPLGRPDVTWGRRSGRRAKHTLQLGCFDPERNQVRIHPVLDQEAVPRFFVRYVLFHEILHATEPTRRQPTGRAVHHGPAFRARERAYAGYDQALAWQDAHLPALLRSARSGRPMPRRRSAAEDPPRSLGSRIWSGVQGWLFDEAKPPANERRRRPRDQR